MCKTARVTECRVQMQCKLWIVHSPSLWVLHTGSGASPHSWPHGASARGTHVLDLTVPLIVMIFKFADFIIYLARVSWVWVWGVRGKVFGDGHCPRAWAVAFATELLNLCAMYKPRAQQQNWTLFVQFQCSNRLHGVSHKLYFLNCSRIFIDMHGFLFVRIDCPVARME